MYDPLRHWGGADAPPEPTPRSRAPGKRTLTQGMAFRPAGGNGAAPTSGSGGAPTVAPVPAAGGDADAAAGVTSGGVDVLNADYLYEINTNVGDIIFAGRFKGTLGKAATATAAAKGSPSVAPDSQVSGGIDALSPQLKRARSFATKKDTDKRAWSVANHLALTAVKPSVKWDEVFPGVSLSLGGELGQISLKNGLPHLSVATVSFTVSGDVTKWVLGDDAKDIGAKMEVQLQIKYRVDGRDMERLMEAWKLRQQLAKQAQQAERTAEAAMRAARQRKSVEAALAKARRLGARGAAQAGRRTWLHVIRRRGWW
jgi:hypothetical protein